MTRQAARLPGTALQSITSRNNPRLKEVARLVASSRDRRKSGRCVIEGEHLVDVYIGRVGVPETVVVCDDAIHRAGVQAIIERVPQGAAFAISRALFAELAALPADVGVLAVIPAPRVALPLPGRFHLLLDDVQDPGNVGSMLRSAAAAGVDQVLLSKACAFAWSPRTLRAAQGAHFLTTVVEDVDLVAWCEAFRREAGTVVTAVASRGVELYRSSLVGRVAIAIGNEGAGVSSALQERANLRITIPMPGGMESLNAAAAAAVVLFECVRQQRAQSA